MIKNENIKSGYKKTPVGIIPEDWRVRKLGGLVEIMNGISPSKLKIKEQGAYPYLKVEDLNNCFKYQKVSRMYADGVGHIIPKSSIIFPKRGAAILNNKVRINKNEVQLDTNLMAIKPIPNKINGEFLFYKIVWGKLYRIADTSTIPQINNKHIQPYRIPVPPILEQKAIADCLSTWDRAIEKQTQLIYAKKEFKNQLREDFLTGKKRLPGFLNKITPSNLKGKIYQKSKRNKRGLTYKVLSVTNSEGFVDQQEYFDRNISSEDTSNYKIVQKGDFAYNPARVNVGSLARLEKFSEGIISPMYIVFGVDNTQISSTYMKYLLQTYWFIGHIPMFSKGSVRKTLSYNGLIRMNFFIPSLKEQNAISSLLETADIEIELLEKKLDQLKLQKKGLMQVLLTGKKRLV